MSVPEESPSCLLSLSEQNRIATLKTGEKIPSGEEKKSADEGKERKEGKEERTFSVAFGDGSERREVRHCANRLRRRDAGAIKYAGRTKKVVGDPSSCACRRRPPPC